MKMAAKITSFIIALVLVGVFATFFIFATANLNVNHNKNLNNASLDVFGNTTELHELAKEVEEKTNNQGVESGVLDIVGLYISRALDALKLSATSFSVFERMATAGLNKVGLPSFFITAAITIMLIIIIIGVIVSAMVKRDL